MLEHFFRDRRVIERLRSSGFGGQLDGFSDELFVSGYVKFTGSSYIRAAEHLGNWCRGLSISVSKIDEAIVDQFVRHLGDCRCRGSNPRRLNESRAGARQFHKYLEQAGVVEPGLHDRASQPHLVDEFCAWMRTHRGVMQSTLSAYVPLIVEFLGSAGEDPACYDATCIRAFILERARRHGPSRARTVGTAMRMFLRFLSVRGLCRVELVAAVPAIAHWRLSTLPRYLPADDVDRIIASSDPSSPTGARDRAILLLLARLGLRAGDVVSLRLGDIDWHRGRIRVVGKGRREAYLPLPQEVGDAVLTYLHRGRPLVEDDHVFIRAYAPWRPLQNGTSVSRIVGRFIRRSGIQSRSNGAHVLRHSVATQMLREGVPLEGISLLLRHSSIDTTELYAKVDLPSLQSLTQPWPEVRLGSC